MEQAVLQALGSGDPATTVATVLVALTTTITTAGVTVSTTSTAAFTTSTPVPAAPPSVGGADGPGPGLHQGGGGGDWADTPLLEAVCFLLMCALHTYLLQAIRCVRAVRRGAGFTTSFLHSQSLLAPGDWSYPGSL